MKRLLLVVAAAVLLVGILVADAEIADRPLSRQRRRIDQLGHMISATTGHHYAAYIGYGNYCGPGGSGIPVDKLDTCCQSHDLCYAKTKKMNAEGKCGPKGGPVFSPYLSKFSYTDSGDGRLECTDDRSSDYSTCLLELCLCDKVFADCLAPIKGEYDIKNLKDSQKYLRSLVLLIETAPSVSDFVWRIVESLLS